jgi:hypothetical protein
LCLVALGALRARQGAAAAADRRYEEATGCSFNSWLSAVAAVRVAAEPARHNIEALATICSQLTSAAPQRHLRAPGQPCRHAANA